MSIFIRAALAALTITATLTIATSSPATARTGCDDNRVNRADFRVVELTVLNDAPMTRQQVHQMFGTRGRHLAYGTRVYRGCVKGSKVWIQFERDDEGTIRAGATAFTWLYFGDGLETLHPARQGVSS